MNSDRIPAESVRREGNNFFNATGEQEEAFASWSLDMLRDIQRKTSRSSYYSTMVRQRPKGEWTALRPKSPGTSGVCQVSPFLSPMFQRTSIAHECSTRSLAAGIDDSITQQTSALFFLADGLVAPYSRFFRTAV